MSFFKQLFRDVVNSMASRVEVSNPAKVVGNDLVNGDVNILQLAIYKNQVAFDIKSQVTEIHIFESIVSPVIYCNMTVADAINLQSDFIIDIGTIIRFEFQTPGTSQSNEYFFQVNHVGDKRDVPGLTMKVYTVELVSVEAAAAQNISMEGFLLNETSGNLIENVIKDYVDKHPDVSKLNGIRREQRLGIDRGHGIIAKNQQQTRVLPRNRRPFEVIHELALLTNKSPEGHSLYTFFERKDGYQFKPIEGLMKDGKKLLRDDQSDAIFFYDHLRNQNQSAVKFRNILAYNVSSSDNLTEGRAGGVNTVAVTTNPQTGENSAPAAAAADSNVTDFTSAQALRSFDAVTRAENITSTEFNHLNEVLVSRRQLLLRIAQYEAQILIYGDTNLTVGNVIECNFPRSISTSRDSSDPEGGSELSADSGYYLITHLRHIILNTDRPQHIISSNIMRAEPARS
jgi:hypothetical protein